MAKLPILSGYELIKILKKAGFAEKRQKGSHVILVKESPDGKISTVVPLHREVDKGTLLEILRQSRLKREEFFSLL